MAHIFPDSKTFVDMKLTKSPAEVRLAFNKVDTKQPGAIANFVEDHFTKVSNRFEIQKKKSAYILLQLIYRTTS